MHKILLFLIGVFLISSCTEQKNKTIAFASDNPAERVVWERIRLADPNTGEILNNIRQKEMIFAKTLPKSTAMNKANWVHRVLTMLEEGQERLLWMCWMKTRYLRGVQVVECFDLLMEGKAGQ